MTVKIPAVEIDEAIVSYLMAMETIDASDDIISVDFGLDVDEDGNYELELNYFEDSDFPDESASTCSDGSCSV